jgi:hypothetical protein
MARPGETTHWWQAVGNVSQICSALAAVVALAFIAYQVSLIEVNSRKASARQVYLAYSDAGLRYPEFLRPTNYPAIKRDPVKFEQYKWYVAQMMFAYDEMISAAGDHTWVQSFEYEVPDHLALLCDLKASEPRFFTQFEEETNALIDQTLAGKCQTTAGQAPDRSVVLERAQPQPERTQAQPERERAQPERERAQPERTSRERRARMRRKDY